MPTEFRVADPIERDSRFICDLTLCQVRLFDDARYDWLMLVPRRADMVEIFDLEPDDQSLLWQEIQGAASKLKAVTGCHKVNVANLGNLEPQLHIHLIARNHGDPAWPGPVWGHSAAEAYSSSDLEKRLRFFHDQFAPSSQDK